MSDCSSSDESDNFDEECIKDMRFTCFKKAPVKMYLLGEQFFFKKKLETYFLREQVYFLKEQFEGEIFEIILINAQVTRWLGWVILFTALNC